MTNETNTDPQITEFVTKVMDMSPEAPIFPETVVAVTPPARRRLAPWMWAPLAAATAVLVIAPIALRGGGDGDEFAGVPVGSGQAVTEENTSDASQTQLSISSVLRISNKVGTRCRSMPRPLLPVGS